MIQPVAVRPAPEKLASSAGGSTSSTARAAATLGLSATAPPAPPPRHRFFTGDKNIVPEASAAAGAAATPANASESQRRASGFGVASAAASSSALGVAQATAAAPLSRAELEEGVKRLGSSKETLARLQQELNCELVELMEQRVALEVQLETLKRRNWELICPYILLV